MYDGVVYGFGLPYLSKEEAMKLIRDVPGVLNAGGVFYLSAMEGDYIRPGYQGRVRGERSRCTFIITRQII